MSFILCCHNGKKEYCLAPTKYIWYVSKFCFTADYPMAGFLWLCEIKEKQVVYVWNRFLIMSFSSNTVNINEKIWMGGVLILGSEDEIGCITRLNISSQGKQNPQGILKWKYGTHLEKLISLLPSQSQWDM